MPISIDQQAQNAAQKLIDELKSGDLEKVGWPEIWAESARCEPVKSNKVSQTKFAEIVTQKVVTLVG